MEKHITIYRMTTIGKALDESLKELIEENEVKEDLSQKV